MPQPPNTALLGCLTLLAAYVPSNSAHATESTADQLHALDLTPDLTDVELSDATEAVDTAVAINVSPDHQVQPVFASQSTVQHGSENNGPENRLAPTTVQDDNRSNKLNHLVATTLRGSSERSLESVALEPEPYLLEAIAVEPTETDTALEEPVAVDSVVAEQTPQQALGVAQSVDQDSLLTERENVPPAELAGIGGLEDISEDVQAASQEPIELAQLPIEPPRLPDNSEEQQILEELLLEDGAATARPYQSSPAITISNPSGFGADNFTGFVGVGYQSRTRFGNKDDGGLVVGVGLGDARENVGVQLSYTVASFGGSREFGTGGFNAKLHKRLADDWSVALGWEGFATTGFVDFEDSIYGSVSHIIRTRESISDPFSRVALTAGVGSGRFRLEEDVFDDRDTVGVFGSMAVRVAEPVSAIVEWTGQDLALGLSITPFKDLPLVLLPAVRDIAGAGDGGRFVMGAGVSFQL